jgi:hypothetical protein
LTKVRDTPNERASKKQSTIRQNTKIKNIRSTAPFSTEVYYG